VSTKNSDGAPFSPARGCQSGNRRSGSGFSRERISMKPILRRLFAGMSRMPRLVVLLQRERLPELVLDRQRLSRSDAGSP
jgi:hypothetical protein